MLRGSSKLSVILVFLTVLKCFDFHISAETETCCNAILLSKKSTERKQLSSLNASEIQRIKSIYSRSIRSTGFHRRTFYQIPRKKINFPSQYLLASASNNRHGHSTSNIDWHYAIKPTNYHRKRRLPFSLRKLLKYTSSLDSVDGLETVTTPDNQNSSTTDSPNIYEKYIRSIDYLERKFYLNTFEKLSANCPANRRENGISFVQSGLFLHMALTALTATVNDTTRSEIESIISFCVPDKEKKEALRYIMSHQIPESNVNLKFRHSYRLLLASGLNLTEKFQEGPAEELKLKIDYFDKTTDSESLAKTLNRMIELDSKGALRDTFDESDLPQPACSVFVSTLYMRARWRVAPTLLNGEKPFYDFEQSNKTTRMLRINDVVKYADLKDWNAQAVEISYATDELSLLMIVPRGRSIRVVADKLGVLGVSHVTERMTHKRIGVTLPQYTLRMTLLLPNKLRQLGLHSLIEEDVGVPSDSTAAPAAAGRCKRFQLTQAVQRIMFWAEAGRNAYKDDGIEWGEHPEMELVVDRPYAFFVRWRNVTLMNGHFVL